jgi:hypothetical protein
LGRAACGEPSPVPQACPQPLALDAQQLSTAPPMQSNRFSSSAQARILASTSQGAIDKDMVRGVQSLSPAPWTPPLPKLQPNIGLFVANLTPPFIMHGPRVGCSLFFCLLARSFPSFHPASHIKRSTFDSSLRLSYPAPRCRLSTLHQLQSIVSNTASSASPHRERQGKISTPLCLQTHAI